MCKQLCSSLSPATRGQSSCRLPGWIAAFLGWAVSLEHCDGLRSLLVPDPSAVPHYMSRPSIGGLPRRKFTVFFCLLSFDLKNLNVGSVRIVPWSKEPTFRGRFSSVQAHLFFWWCKHTLLLWLCQKIKHHVYTCFSSSLCSWRREIVCCRECFIPSWSRCPTCVRIPFAFLCLWPETGTCIMGLV